MTADHLIYEQELRGYTREIAQLEGDIDRMLEKTRVTPGIKLTRQSLGIGNRANMILVGLCGLVEVKLMQIADDHGRSAGDPVGDYLKDNHVIDFGKLQHWPGFCDLRTLRNGLVHGYGGIVPVRDIKRLERAVARLGMDDVLVAGRRVRMSVGALGRTRRLICELFHELSAGQADRPLLYSEKVMQMSSVA
jgi:hypothetical protein